MSNSDAVGLIKAFEHQFPDNHDGNDGMQVCSLCFSNAGLRLDAEHIGTRDEETCPRCEQIGGAKLTARETNFLAHRFFVLGSTISLDYGAAPYIEFNKHQKTSERLRPMIGDDLSIFEDILGVGFFEYGPRLWMLGEIEPLRDLQNESTRLAIVDRILHEYPTVTLQCKDIFYRVRSNPSDPSFFDQYDSPPKSIETKGRLDSTELSILYASPDIQTCLHECRVSSTDEVYLAKLVPQRDLKLLNLTHHLEEAKTEFESLDLAIHFLFLADENSYDISRAISEAALDQGYDGILFPSYFSFLRTGSEPYETILGMSSRMIDNFRDKEASKLVPNIALFGHPINEGKVGINSISRVFLERVEYSLRYGPVISEY